MYDYTASLSIYNELRNPDPRIRLARARRLGYAVDAEEMIEELQAITEAVSADAVRSLSELGENVVSQLENAVYRLETTIRLFPRHLSQSALLEMLNDTKEAIKVWVWEHGITPAWLSAREPDIDPSDPSACPAVLLAFPFDSMGEEVCHG